MWAADRLRRIDGQDTAAHEPGLEAVTTVRARSFSTAGLGEDNRATASAAAGGNDGFAGLRPSRELAEFAFRREGADRLSLIG